MSEPKITPDDERIPQRRVTSKTPRKFGCLHWVALFVLYLAVLILTKVAAYYPVVALPLEIAFFLVGFVLLGFAPLFNPELFPFGGWLRFGLMTLCVTLLAGVTVMLVRRIAPQAEDEASQKPTGRRTRQVFATVLLLGTVSFAGAGALTEWYLITASDAKLFGPRWATRKLSWSKNNLKQTGLAFHNHHDTMDAFPPGVLLGEHLEPLHGWPTLLLPYVDHAPLFEQIDLEKPWDDEVNREAFRTHVASYHNPLYAADPDGDGYSPIHYAGNSRLLEPGRRMRLRDVSDGTSTTILGGEIARNFRPWGEPFHLRDPALGLNTSPNGFGADWRGRKGCHLMFADGSVRFLSAGTDREVLRRLATPDGGDAISDSDLLTP